MPRRPAPTTAPPAPPAGTIEGTRYYLGVMIDALKDCSHKPEHVRQAMRELLVAEPEFTDTARAALLWVLWHHQGGSSPVGQAVRFALGMGQFDRLTSEQLARAKSWAPGIPGLAHQPALTNGGKGGSDA